MLHEPVSSLNLMERAATTCADWISQHTDVNKKIIIYCGPGNNGGDGLVIARILLQQGRNLQVYFLEGMQSEDFKANFERLLQQDITPQILSATDLFPEHNDGEIILDALFGYGLNRPLSGIADALVQHINRTQSTIISIDIPSGLFADKSSKDNTIVQAAHILTFQAMKLAFLLPENAVYIGEVTVLDIGLHTDFYNNTDAAFEIVTHSTIHSWYTARKKFSHKGSYGSAALVAGSYGMMGAAVLGAQACMRSGAGKLTCYIPKCGYTVIQSVAPEAMCVTDENETHHTNLQLKGKYDAYAIGPGIGQSRETATVVEALLQQKPERLVMDADALNILAAHPHLLQLLPANAILTPHPKEFEKLFGKTDNEFNRLQLALAKAKSLNVYIVLKGYYTFIATPAGKGYFNATGNPGMATAGSGDVLTGILLGLYAQNHDAQKVVLTGVFLHGLAGDLAAAEKTEEALIAGDIASHLSAGWQILKNPDYFQQMD